MITNRSRLLPVLALGLTAALAACQPKALSMTPEETQRVEALTANMTTRCVGRYLVDLPEPFVLNSESRTEIEGVKVAMQPMDRRLFDVTVEAREAQLTRETIVGSFFGTNIPSLTQVHRLPNQSGLVFDRSKTGESPVERTLELSAWKGGYFIEALVDARDITLAKRKRPELATNTPEKLAHLLKIYERISGRKDTEIPSPPGLCIPNGFVAGAGREGQDTDAVYHLADAPDVWFGFGSTDAVHSKTSLFQRSSEIETVIKQEELKTIRKQKRTLHGLSYEEWLLSNHPYQDGVRGTKFYLYGNELRGDPENPFIELKLLNGDRIPVGELSMAQKDKLRLNEVLSKPTLTDAEALAIWDKVSATLRPRTGAY